MKKFSIIAILFVLLSWYLKPTTAQIGIASSNLQNPSAGGGGSISGSGTANTITKFTAATVVGNSNITDNGTTISIGGTAFTVPIAGGAAPTADGDFRYDSTQDAYSAGGAGALNGHIPRVLFVTNCSTEGNCTTTNEVDATAGQQGTTETTFNSTFTVPADYLIANKMIRVCAGFQQVATASPPGCLVRLKLGSTNIYQGATFTPTASATRQSGGCWNIIGTAAAGASVNVETSVMAGTTATDQRVPSIETLTQPIAIATNASQVLGISATWNATGNHQIRLRTFTVEELN